MTINSTSPTSFELHLGQIPTKSMDETREVVLQIFGTVVPSLDVMGIDVMWLGKRARRDNTGAIDFQEWNITYLVSSDFSNWKTLFDWVNYLTTNNRIPSEVVVPGILYIKNNFGEDVMRIVFIDLWIKNLGEITLSTQNGEEFLQGTASFDYSRYEVHMPGEPVEG
jgi:hypothetical protein